MQQAIAMLIIISNGSDDAYYSLIRVISNNCKQELEFTFKFEKVLKVTKINKESWVCGRQYLADVTDKRKPA